LSKRFGSLRALEAVSFSIHRGEVLGLIGPNGAGKTTLLECMAGLLPADGGETIPHTAANSSTTFYVPDGITPWETRAVGGVLRFFDAIHVAHAGARDALIAELSLSQLLDQPVGTLSRGQRKRLLLALGLLVPRPLLLLDEPFDGLDLRQIREVAGVLRRHAAGGRTLFLSIHQLVDAARVCDRMVLLSAGRVVGVGTLDELRSNASLPHAGIEEVFLALT
jgi:ABC-2 type transport system ATP-binding protein